MKKLVAALVASFGIMAATPASAIIVGGIDFGTLGEGSQASELETATFGETLINGTGQSLSGYGVVNTVNGDNTYCADNTANCALYFYFHDYTSTSFSGSHVEFTGGLIDLYYSGAPQINLLSLSSLADIAFITGRTAWAELTGHTFTDPIFNTAAGTPGATYTLNGNGTLTGASLSENGAGLVDVALGGFGLPSVQAYLNGNSQLDGLGGFADKALTSSSNSSVLNPNDPPCTFTPGQFCFQGTANLRGATVPVSEPESLALLALVLLGLGFSTRRRANSAS